MTCNVGGIERSIRIGVGLLAMSIGFFAGLSTTMAAVMVGVGAILLVTGMIRFCPLSVLFGINTCSSSHDAKS